MAVLLAAPIALLIAAAGLRGQDDDKAARGKYLVEEVAKCQDCHTPRLETGEFDRTNWMKGTTLDFQPIKAPPKWHSFAPNITGSGRLFERWGEAALLKYLETGLGPKGKPADAPMPAYKLKAGDAEAMVAYLKTLK